MSPTSALTDGTGSGSGKLRPGVTFQHVSVLIPVGPGETTWRRLLQDLHELLPDDAEVLFAARDPEPDEFTVSRPTRLKSARWLQVRPGRAAQMNDAASAASREFLWFLHADSRVSSRAAAALGESLLQHPDALHFFRLRFYDGPRWLRLNEIGVALRCAVFGLPFGDQGFCLRRDTFFQLGGYDESAEFGEDHLLIWAARSRGVPLRRLPVAIATSGRKYAEHGWARTTFQHLFLTARQAFPHASRRRGRR